MNIAISDIRIGERRRQELGDLEALARSIERYGLLHPPVVDHEHTLVAGLRRVRAHELLGRTEIEVRIFEDLTEAERREIELEENIRRKDLTDYERSKRLIAQGERLAPIISGTLPEKNARGRKPVHDVSKAEIATALGTSERTLRRAEQHVDAVERYPELQEMPQGEALTTSQELDHLTEEESQQRRATIREEVAQRGSGRGRTHRGQAGRTSSPRKPSNYSGRWFKAMHHLWRVSELTRNQPAILALAGRWPLERLRRYCDDLQRVQTRLNELLAAFEPLLAAAEGAASADEPAADESEALGDADAHGGFWSDEGANLAAEDDTRVGPDAPEGCASAGVGAAPQSPADAREQAVISGDRAVDGAVTAGADEPHAVVADCQWDEGGAADQAAHDHVDCSATPSRVNTLEEQSKPGNPPALGSASLGDHHHAADRRATLLSRVMALRAEGHSCRAIATHFNAERVPTLSGKGAWDHRTLSRLLCSAARTAPMPLPERDPPNAA